MNRTIPITQLPADISFDAAVDSACSNDIAFIEEHLLRSLSVLVECDKEMTLFLYLAVRSRLRRQSGAPRLVLIDGRPRPDDPPASNMARMLQQLTDAIRGSVERTILVMPHLDVLTTTHTGLTLEAREAIPLLYENPEVVILGFRDPSFEIPKVIRGVFPIRREIVGVPREALPKLITQREARSIHSTEMDPYALYKYVSGLNPVRCRRVFSDLSARHEAPPGRSFANEVYREIRRQTATDDIELPNVDLETDIGGYGEVKNRLREDLIDLVLRKDNLKSEADIKALEELLPRGVIFHGPPGTGKTFFAKGIATALNATVIVVSGPELKSKWVGESEENLRQIFRKARQAAPSVIVFDEIDAFAHARGTYQGSGVEHSMVNQLLSEMDGFRKNEMVFIVGTTNFLESLDSALLRPGRFEFLIEIPAPDQEDRKAILEIYNRKMNLGLKDEHIAHLVRRTEGYADREKGLPFSGDHLYAVCRSLKRVQLRTGATSFTTDDLDKALQRRTRRPIALSKEEERVIAIHESGHALVAMLCPKATPPEKISLTQDMEGALGYVLREARARPYALTAEEMRADICVGLGGQAAERLVIGEISIGASMDLRQATHVARAMVEDYGMSQSVGPRVMTVDDRVIDGRGVSESLRTQIDQEIDRILREEKERAEKLLKDNLHLHAALVELLLEKKVLDASAIKSFASKTDAKPDAK